MTIDEIKELIRVLNETGIAELEVQRGENRVRIRRSIAPSPQEFVIPHVAPVMAPSSIPSPVTVQQASAPSPVAAAAAQPSAADPLADAILVKSPIVGTYYESPAPGAPVFVQVGDRVQPGQVLCIIESMKLMNEIEAEVAGTVVSKLVENGRPVEYGEALFALKP